MRYLKNETELLVTALMTPNMFRGGKHNCSSRCIFHKGKGGGKPRDFNTTLIHSLVMSDGTSLFIRSQSL